MCNAPLAGRPVKMIWPSATAFLNMLYRHFSTQSVPRKAVDSVSALGGTNSVREKVHYLPSTQFFFLHLAHKNPFHHGSAIRY